MTTGDDQILFAVRTALGAYRGARVCVALSGGLDSVVLLHALDQLRTEMSFELIALHVHHGLSLNADNWAEFCRRLCNELNVPCEVVCLTLTDAAGKGLERVAREARYEAFAAAPSNVLCLAHHQNDRAETFLLNLFRGAGATGLGGVPEVRTLGDKTLIRPLIDTPRTNLEAWASTHQLRWIEDESNQNLFFRRNYVRHRVLPAITEMYPGAVSVLARTSAQMSEQAALLDRLAERDAQDCRDLEGILSVTRLQLLAEPAVRNVLRYALTQAGVQIPAARRLQEFSAQLMTAGSDTEALVRMGSTGVHLWRDRVWVDPAMDMASPPPIAAQCGSFVWPDGQLDIAGSLVDIHNVKVAPLEHGQRFHPQGRCRDRASELLRAQGVPPWVRPRLPGLFVQDHLVWLPVLDWGEGSQEMQQHVSITWTDAMRQRCL